MPYAQRAVVNTFLRLPPRATGRTPGAMDDTSRKRKRDGEACADLDGDRTRLREETDAELVRFVREYDWRCAKYLLEEHSALRSNAHQCTQGTTHTDAYSWAVLDGNIELPREGSDAIHAQSAAILKWNKNLSPPYRSGGGYRAKRGGGRVGHGGASGSGFRGQGFRRGLSGGSRK